MQDIQHQHKQDHLKCIAQGAQAKIYLKEPNEQEFKKVLVKKRVPKKYRHPDLDHKINDSRVKTEVKNLKKALKIGLNVPEVYKVYDYTIQMQWVDGMTAKQYFRKIGSELNSKEDEIYNKGIEERVKKLLEEIAQIIYKMHNYGLIHGDLTTSNMILRQNDPKKLYLIDFGLSYIKDSIQDKAVDLYVLQKAFISTHPEFQNEFANYFIPGYPDELVLKRLQAVRQRGRKKIAFG